MAAKWQNLFNLRVNEKIFVTGSTRNRSVASPERVIQILAGLLLVKPFASTVE
ncbi:MAG TPA: hypothetical protein VHC04_17665 [Rhodopila sp.]|nr:hypothetical protein [Rhodopila sp.]